MLTWKDRMSTADLQLDYLAGKGGIDSQNAQTLACAASDPLLNRRLACTLEIPLFYGLTNAERTSLAANAHVRDIPDGQAIFREGQRVSCVIVLVSGRVKITRFSASGEHVLFRIVNVGQEVGTLGATPGTPHTTTAQTAGVCRVLTWDASVFENLCHQIPALTRNGLRISAERQRLVEDRFFELVTERAPARLARLLVRLLEQSCCSASKPARIEGLVQLDISQMIGTTLWTVNRLLHEWEHLGLLEVQRGVVIVPDPKQLLTFAEKIGAVGDETNVTV